MCSLLLMMLSSGEPRKSSWRTPRRGGPTFGCVHTTQTSGNVLNPMQGTSPLLASCSLLLLASSPSLLLLPFSFTRWCPNRQFPNVRLATQNIDRLHLRAGCDPHRVAEVHGALGVYRCTKLFAFEFPFFSSHLSFLHESPEMCDLKQQTQNSSCKFSRTEQLEGVVLHRDEAGRVVPPRCPACGSLVMPMTLLFDEMYSSHVFFKNDVVSDWLDRAEVFVFAGTSLSVGITTAALHTVAAWNAEAFAMNVAPQHRRIPCSSGTPATLHDIVGPCEATLPLLAALCTTPSSPSLCSPSRSFFPLSCEIQ